MNNKNLEETKRLNAKSRANSGMTNSGNTSMTSSTNNSDLEEAKRANAQSGNPMK